MNPVISLILSFAILAILMKKMPYGYAVVISTSIFLLLASPENLLPALSETVSSYETAELVSMIILVNVLAHVMKGLGMIDDFVTEIKKFLSAKSTLVVLPAFMGLLPIPGGALMSAPLIERSARSLKLNAEVLAFSNIWFRHIVMPVFPLTPSIIILANFTGVGIYDFIFHMTPFFFLMTFTGYLFLRDIPRTSPKGERGDLKKIVKSSAPIIIPVILNSIGLSLLLSITLGVLSAFLLRKTSLKEALELVKGGWSSNLFFATFGVMFFKNALESSSLIPMMKNFISSSGIPLWVLTVAVSSAISVLFGAMMAGLAISISLLHPFIDGNMMYLCLLYGPALMAYLLSPMHLCTILTFEYFHSDFRGFYRMMIPPAIITVAVSIPLFLSYGYL
ncbi:MAG: DUF401 family protein [Archaeoglobi archaeon]|nr:DUF401 family protein [Candidatus Mnemosynella sp.]MBC7115376.1 DUF401 family protein [Candidatus Mnemosynella bozhongmuii]